MDIARIASVKVMDGATTLAEFTDQFKFLRYMADGPKFTRVTVTSKDGTEESFGVVAVNMMIKHHFPDGITNTFGNMTRP